MKTYRIIFVVLLGTVLPTSCYKKEKNRIAGEYHGWERHVHIGPYGDTLRDTTYPQNLTMTLTDRKTFTVTKSTYPFEYTINANRLAIDDSVRKISFGFPSEVWTIRAAGGALSGTFDEDNSWAGSHDHYTFTGTK